MRTSLLLAVVSMLSAGPPRPGPPLAIQVSPIVAVEPANVLISATVEENDANRAIEVIAESASFYRSSERPLDGRRSPRITTIELRDVPVGYLEIRVMLKGSAGRTIAAARSHVTVLRTRAGEP